MFILKDIYIKRCAVFSDSGANVCCILTIPVS